MRIAHDVRVDSIGPHFNGIIGEVCNITNYTNGVVIYPAPFVNRGLLYLNGSRVTNSDSWNGNGQGDWSIKLPNVYIQAVGATGNRLFEIEDVAGNNRIDCAVISGAHRFGFKQGGGATNYISGVVIPINTLSEVEIRFTGLDTSKLITVYVNSVPAGSINLDISAGWPFERFSVASSSPSGNEYTCLVGGFEIEPLDYWNLKTNQDDGLSIIGESGNTATIVEASPGETQLPGTGFTWPVDTFAAEPATGDIYRSTTLLGNRDRYTLIFTPNAAEVPNWAFVEDVYCPPL